MSEEIPFEHVIIDEDGPENPHTKAVGDVNGDGFVDILVASSVGGPLVWYEYPDWTRHVVAPAGTWSTDAKLVDMDGDGDLDIVISEWYTENRMEWYENPLPDGDPGAGPWKRHDIGQPRAHDFRMGDLDGDGILEIVSRTQGKDGDHILVWKRSGQEWRNRAFPCPRGEGIALGDVNGDGRPEVVIGGRWYAAPGDVLEGDWQEHVFGDWPPDAVVKLADLTGNGRLDVVLVRSEGPHKLCWFEAPEDASGDWTEHVVDDSVDYAHSLQVADLNGNGLPDIVTAEMHQSERRRVMVYLNEGGARSWHRQVVATTGSHNMCVADAGNTGYPDLIGANWSGDYQPVQMWRNMLGEGGS